MAPRSASRCCRAVRSHLTGASPTSPLSTAALAPTPDAVWITDSLLASAFARYCRCSPSYYSSSSSPSSSSPPTAVTLSPRNTRRFASNVPGPLESRRRLGKRQMTDQLSMQLSLNPSASMPPAWGLPNAPDLRQWQWSPPRDSSLLSRQVDTKSNFRQGDGLAPWATTPASSPPSIFPSFAMPKWLTELGETAEPGDAAAEFSETGSASAENSMVRSATAQPFFTKLRDWSQSVREAIKEPRISEAGFARQFDDICSEYQTQLSLAALTVDETGEAFGLLWDGLNGNAESSPQRHLVKYAPTLYSAVLQGIGACRLLQANDFGVDFWRDLLARVSQLPSSQQTATTTTEILLAMPPLFLNQMADILPQHLCAIFSYGHPGTLAEATGTLAETIAKALQQIDFDQHGSFVDATTELLRSGVSGVSADGHAIVAPALDLNARATGWLFTLAHIPQVRQDRLYKTMSQLQLASQAKATSGAWHMRSAELCELLLAQWISRGYVTQQAQHSFRRMMRAMRAGAGHSSTVATNGHDPAALAALALAVFRSKHSRLQCVALYVSLWRGLQVLGRDAELVPSVAALLSSLELGEQQQQQGQQGAPAPLPPPPAAFFEALAWATDDAHTAVRLHELYASTVAQSSRQRLWSVGFWDKFADRLAAALDQGLLTPGQVSHALDLPTRSATSTGVKIQKTQAKGPGAPTVALVEKLAMHFALAPSMVPRRALRGVEQCRAFLVAHGRRQQDKSGPQESVKVSSLASTTSFSPTSPTILRALFHLITRDLASAQLGRTSRLRWFLRIVAREHSEAAAVSSGRALTRWRDAATRYRKTEERRAVYDELQEEQARQTTREGDLRK